MPRRRLTDAERLELMRNFNSAQLLARAAYNRGDRDTANATCACGRRTQHRSGQCSRCRDE